MSTDPSPIPTATSTLDLESPFSDDMNAILNPSMDNDEDDGVADADDSQRFFEAVQNSGSSSLMTSPSNINDTFSLDDSVIHRVEQEIEDARRTALVHSDPKRDLYHVEHLRNILLGSTLTADEMDQILQTVTSNASTTMKEDEDTDGNPMLTLDFSLDDGTKSSQTAVQLYSHQEENEEDLLEQDQPATSNDSDDFALPDDILQQIEDETGQLAREPREPSPNVESESLNGSHDEQVVPGSSVISKEEPSCLGHVEEKKTDDDDDNDDDDVPTCRAKSTLEKDESFSDPDILIINSWSGDVEISMDEDDGADSNVQTACDTDDDEEAAANAWEAKSEEEIAQEYNLDLRAATESEAKAESKAETQLEEEVDEQSKAQSETQPDEQDEVQPDEKHEMQADLQPELPKVFSDDIEMSLEESLSRMCRNLSHIAAEPDEEGERLPELDYSATDDVEISLDEVLNVEKAKSVPENETSHQDSAPEVGNDDGIAEEDTDAKPEKLAGSTTENFDSLPTATAVQGTNTAQTIPRPAPLILGVPKPRNPKPSLHIKTDAASTPNSGMSVSSARSSRSRIMIQPSRRIPNTTGSLRDSRKTGARQGFQQSRKDTPSKEEMENEEALLKTSRKLRFRRPFPVLKPSSGPRSSEEIVKTHAIELVIPPVRWLKPKKELRQLIVAAMGTSLQRRSNACGALKVLTLHKKNQLSLVRTDSFLTALIFTASQNLKLSDRELSIVARTRAVTCLRNVSLAKENRVQIFTHPGLPECLIKVVETDRGEGRVLACATLALLAKSPDCREGLGTTAGVVEALARVLGETVLPPETELQHKVVEESEGTGHDTFTDSESDADSRSRADDRERDYEDYDTLSGSSDESESDIDEESIIKIKKQPETPKHAKARAECHQDARSNSCAVLVHLSRCCSISNQLAQNELLVSTCVRIAMEISNPIHIKCIEILRNLSLFPSNNAILCRAEGVVNTFVAGANSQHAENRLSSLRALQNISADASSKSLLAVPHVLNMLTSCAIRKDLNEKEAAVATLHNISTEPSTVVSLMNTKNVIATLVHVAHHPETTSNVRLLACDALATTSLWLQTLAGTGKCPDGVPNVLLPSQKTYGWQRWD